MEEHIKDALHSSLRILQIFDNNNPENAQQPDLIA